MASKYDIEESLQASEDYIEILGHTVEDEIEGSVGEDSLRGLVCGHGSHTYLVMASDAWDWIRIRYPLNVDQVYAARRLSSDSDGHTQQISDAEIQQGRRELDDRLDDMPSQDRRKFRINIIQMLSRENLILELDTTSPLNIHGFNLDKYLFISKRDFSVSDFHEGVQTVTNLGWVGKEFFLENYGFRPDPQSGQNDEHEPGNADYGM